MEPTTTSLTMFQSIKLCFHQAYSSKTILALFTLGMVQLYGIDGVFYYAPTIFNQAGLPSQSASFLASGLGRTIGWTLPEVPKSNYINLEETKLPTSCLPSSLRNLDERNLKCSEIIGLPGSPSSIIHLEYTLPRKTSPQPYFPYIRFSPFKKALELVFKKTTIKENSDPIHK